MADKCTNRTHCLGSPPPVLRDRLLPRGGCMACTTFAKGACAYRGRYGCKDEDREVGLALGACVFELSYRESIAVPTRELLSLLSEPRRAEALRHLEMFLDAAVYASRSGVWMALAGDAARYSHEDDVYFRALDRYRTGASLRMTRRYADLAPYVAEAKGIGTGRLAG